MDHRRYKDYRDDKDHRYCKDYNITEITDVAGFSVRRDCNECKDNRT